MYSIYTGMMWDHGTDSLSQWHERRGGGHVDTIHSTYSARMYGMYVLVHLLPYTSIMRPDRDRRHEIGTYHLVSVDPRQRNPVDRIRIRTRTCIG